MRWLGAYLEGLAYMDLSVVIPTAVVAVVLAVAMYFALMGAEVGHVEPQ